MDLLYAGIPCKLKVCGNPSCSKSIGILFQIAQMIISIFLAAKFYWGGNLKIKYWYKKDGSPNHWFTSNVSNSQSQGQEHNYLSHHCCLSGSALVGSWHEGQEPGNQIQGCGHLTTRLNACSNNIS